MLLSRYAVVPRGHAVTMRRYTRTKQWHAEQVLCHQVDCWLVEMPPLREIQRTWSIQQFGKPSITRCRELVELVTGRLSKPARKARVLKDAEGNDRRDDEGNPVYGANFKERYWREELARLKAAALLWLSINEESESRCVYLKANTGWMASQPLSESEMELATSQGQSLVPVLVHGETYAAAMLAETAAWQNAKTVQRVPNRSNPAGKKLDYLKLAAELWSYLPQREDRITEAFDPYSLYAEGDELLQVPMGSVAWPSNEVLERNTDGSLRKPQWLRAVEERKMVITGSPFR